MAPIDVGKGWLVSTVEASDGSCSTTLHLGKEALHMGLLFVNSAMEVNPLLHECAVRSSVLAAVVGPQPAHEA